MDDVMWVKKCVMQSRSETRPRVFFAKGMFVGMVAALAFLSFTKAGDYATLVLPLTASPNPVRWLVGDGSFSFCSFLVVVPVGLFLIGRIVLSESVRLGDRVTMVGTLLLLLGWIWLHASIPLAAPTSSVGSTEIPVETTSPRSW